MRHESLTNKIMCWKTKTKQYKQNAYIENGELVEKTSKLAFQL